MIECNEQEWEMNQLLTPPHIPNSALFPDDGRTIEQQSTTL